MKGNPFLGHKEDGSFWHIGPSGSWWQLPFSCTQSRSANEIPGSTQGPQTDRQTNSMLWNGNALKQQPLLFLGGPRSSKASQSWASSSTAFLLAFSGCCSLSSLRTLYAREGWNLRERPVGNSRVLWLWNYQLGGRTEAGMRGAEEEADPSPHPQGF